VGGGEETALGVLTNAVIALAAQNRAGDDGARFVIFDGTRPDSPLVGVWERVAEALPHRWTVVGVRDVTGAIGDVAAELARREAAGREDVAPIYLVIYNGGRFRELRRGEDDFGFGSSSDKPAEPDKQWAEILRNGPAWGVHSLVWCDSYNNVNRMIDRMMMREFEMRVAFQMSAADSTSLLDTPAAGRLSMHRGLFYSEDTGALEKFRPYELPTDEWLARVRQALSARAAAAR
jgi:S-DNA-T family DNA segregation ATPase FtsK/SpoIIIE